MIARFIKAMSWSLTGAALISISIAAVGSVSRPEAPEARRHTAPAAPYAQAMWIKLSDLIPTGAEGADVYVRLIAIEGEVLLPVDDDR